MRRRVGPRIAEGLFPGGEHPPPEPAAPVADREPAFVGSAECRNCHDFTSMDLSEQDRSARKKHSRAIDEGETCIDCHKGIAHRLPDMHEVDPTIVLVTHDMDTLWRVADRVVLLGDGRLLAEGSMQELTQSDDPAVVRFFQGPRGRAAQASA